MVPFQASPRLALGMTMSSGRPRGWTTSSCPTTAFSVCRFLSSRHRSALSPICRTARDPLLYLSTHPFRLEYRGTALSARAHVVRGDTARPGHASGNAQVPGRAQDDVSLAGRATVPSGDGSWRAVWSLGSRKGQVRRDHVGTGRPRPTARPGGRQAHLGHIQANSIKLGNGPFHLIAEGNATRTMIAIRA